GGKRCWFGLGGAHYATGQQIGIVEDRSVGVHVSITQVSAFMDGTWGFRRVMTGNASRKRKLLKQFSHTFFVLLNAGVELCIGAFKIGVRDHPGAAMARTANVNNIEIILLDQAIEVHVDKVK